MRKLAVVVICFAFLFSISGCAGKWQTLAGISEWTKQNSKSLAGWYEKGSAEEKAFLKTYVNPYMNILKHSCSALQAYEDGDDMLVAKEIYYVTEVGVKLGVSYQSLIHALETGDEELAAQELTILKAKIQTEAGVKPQRDKPGFIRRAWNAMFW